MEATEKVQQNKAVDKANSEQAKGTGNATFQFADNRPVKTLQQNISSIANNSPLANRNQTLQTMADNYTEKQPTVQQKKNQTGLPEQLKSGVENLSGHSLDDVKVHYNSAAPAQMQAHAFAQGSEIHVAPGQEKHLPHEAWHVVQQKQGRVKPTKQLKSKVNINDDKGLEKEADVMGSKAMQMQRNHSVESPLQLVSTIGDTVQRLTGVELELHVPFYGKRRAGDDPEAYFREEKMAGKITKSEGTTIANFIFGGLDYGTSYGKVDGLYDISADHIGFSVNHHELYAYLVSQGYMNNLDPFESMTNMEYRSKAFEERDPASQAKLDQTADQIKAHAVDAAGKATSGSAHGLLGPVGSYFTGVPVAALKKLLAGDGPGLTLVDQMHSAVQPRIYMQTTTGTLPSEVPDLFTEAAKDIKDKNAVNPKAGLLEYSVSQAAMAFNANSGSPLMLSLNSGEKRALIGWMTLVAQYLLAYQLETSSYRFYEDARDGNKLKMRSGTAKNLVAYLSKTHLVDSIIALPLKSRPNIESGMYKDDWIALFVSLLDHTTQPNFNLTTTLGLTEYDTQNYYDTEGNNPKPVEHDEILGTKKPKPWLGALLKQSKGRAFHVQTGNKLTLDDGQENQAPPLSIKGEQAIPLEDRYMSHKQSSGDLTDISTADTLIKGEWTKATDRRKQSTKSRKTFTDQLAAARAFINSYGTAVPLVGSLNTIKNSLDAIKPNPYDLTTEQTQLNLVRAAIQNWQLLHNEEETAYNLIAPLILDVRWDNKGKGIIGTKTPGGVTDLRATVNGNKTPAQKLQELEQKGTAKGLTAEKNRHATVTLLYDFMRDMNPLINGGGRNWNLFITKLNTVEGGL